MLTLGSKAAFVIGTAIWSSSASALEKGPAETAAVMAQVACVRSGATAPPGFESVRLVDRENLEISDLCPCKQSKPYIATADIVKTGIEMVGEAYKVVKVVRGATPQQIEAHPGHFGVKRAEKAPRGSHRTIRPQPIEGNSWATLISVVLIGLDVADDRKEAMTPYDPAKLSKKASVAQDRPNGGSDRGADSCAPKWVPVTVFLKSTAIQPVLRRPGS